MRRSSLETRRSLEAVALTLPSMREQPTASPPRGRDGPLSPHIDPDAAVHPCADPRCRLSRLRGVCTGSCSRMTSPLGTGDQMFELGTTAPGRGCRAYAEALTPRQDRNPAGIVDSPSVKTSHWRGARATTRKSEGKKRHLNFGHQCWAQSEGPRPRFDRDGASRSWSSCGPSPRFHIVARSGYT